jgi:Subtilase family/Bacterial pre-peptidase C-terminal domain
MSKPYAVTALAFAAIVVAGTGAVRADRPAPYQIRLLAGSFTPPAGTPEPEQKRLAQAAATAAAQGQERVHVLLQLHAIPSAAEKHALWRDGVDLGAYVPDRAWIAAVPPGLVTGLSHRPDVRYVTPWDANRKLHPRVAAGQWAPWTRDPDRPGWVMTFVLLHHDVPLEAGDAVAAAVGGVAMPPVSGLHGLTVWVEEERAAELAQHEEVLWVEEGPPPLTATNDGVRATMRVDPVNNPPYSLDGAGVRLFVFDAGTARVTHETFNPGTGSRVTAIDSQASADHPTHVAGTAAGDGSGSSGGRGKGVAPGASILSAGYEQTGGTMLFWDNAGDIEADYDLARTTHNADLGTNSIGSNTAANGYPCEREGDYGVSAALLDGIVRGDNPAVGSAVAMSWANGNERTGGSPRGRCGSNYHTTAEPSCAKNPIHVGALNSDGSSMTSFSSWGPCDDGRLKPVISAPGCESGRVTGETNVYSSLNTNNSAYGGFCGTSMATPAVGGTISLLTQDWRNSGHGGPNDRPLAALVKAWLVHSARDLGQDGPDYGHGYGGVDAQAAVDLQRAGTGVLGGAGPVVWGTDAVATSDVDTFFFDVPAGTALLKATLAWDDAAAAAFAAVAPVNNLTLELVAPDASVRQAWVLDPANPHLPATTGANSLDNQEQVVVENPAAGTWTVRVTGTAVPQGPQSYALVYSTAAATYDPINCSTQNWGFETGNEGWTLSGGAARVASPAPGHGSFSIRLGNTTGSTHEATIDLAVPSDAKKSELTYYWYMTTNEGSFGFGWDPLRTEIRTTAGAVLAVVDNRNDGGLEALWQQWRNIDLTPWAGQTVRIAFMAVNDGSLSTAFWIDDVALETCTTGEPQPVTETFTSIGGHDGRVIESGENTNVGGTADDNDTNANAIRVGDTNQDRQQKGIVSFDTSSIPDGATIQSATVRLRRGSLTGTNPFGTHGSCLADIVTGAFGGSTTLAASDFEAAATATGVASMTNPTVNGALSEGALNAAGLAAINKAGTTQFRVYFTLDDNDDTGNDYLGFYSGENGTASNRPVLEVTYLP